MDENSDMDHAEAARITREHEKARQVAIDDVAARNRKAHEVAKRAAVAGEREDGDPLLRPMMPRAGWPELDRRYPGRDERCDVGRAVATHA